MALEAARGGSLFLLIQAEAASRRGLIQALVVSRGQSYGVDQVQGMWRRDVKEGGCLPKMRPSQQRGQLPFGEPSVFGLAIATAVIWWLASSDSGSVSTPNPKRVALENMELTDITWKKDGFGSVMVMSATIKNNGASAVKDVEIDCDHSSNSGTKLDSNSGVVYEIVPAGKSVKINDFSMGFIHSQAASTNCKITDVVPL